MKKGFKFTYIHYSTPIFSVFQIFHICRKYEHLLYKYFDDFLKAKTKILLKNKTVAEAQDVQTKITAHHLNNTR